ncbi:MAG: hypothetical protein AAGI01_04275 [Myxococcota bacterium]
MRSGLMASWLVLAALAFTSCTDTGLYSPLLPRKEADRVALTGRVCSEDPVQARFPVRVIMMVDQAGGDLYSDYDAAGLRLPVLRDFVSAALTDPQTQMAIVGYGGRPRKLAPLEGDFTRNPGELLAAVNQLSIPSPCVDETLCRDQREALRTVSTLIEGDLAKVPAGLRVLTQYVVVMVAAGPAQPLASNAQCCAPTDQACIDAAQDTRSVGCEAQLMTERVEELRDEVAQAGAAGLRFHTIHLAASTDMATNDQVEQVLELATFAGGGIYQRYNVVSGFSIRALELLGLRTVLRAKLLLVANLNARPGPDGPLVDSDADGLADVEEEEFGTSPVNADTDGDGVSDRVEVFGGFDPNMPSTPRTCQNITPGTDRDLDGLTDCDEELLGTEPTLVDTDGDGMPDLLEVIGLTDYINRDAEVDADGDGVSNGDEILLRGDPRSTDTRNHLTFGYRYEIEDEGVQRELFASKPVKVTGVEFFELTAGTTAGLGLLTATQEPGPSGTTRTFVSWQDPEDSEPGPRVRVDAGGEFELPSSSWAPEQGADGKLARVLVDPTQLAPTQEAESIRVSFRERQCLNYTVRNIRLVPTLAVGDDLPAGTNRLLMYFAQAPEDRLEAPGPYRLRDIRVIFDPPLTREPDDAILEIRDDEFVRPTIRLPE